MNFLRKILKKNKNKVNKKYILKQRAKETIILDRFNVGRKINS